MEGQEYKITSSYLRSYLAQIRKLTGPQYVRLLEQVGLGQYAHSYPPHGSEIVATGVQLIAINKTIKQMLGADLYRLFMKNLGREFGQVTANFPIIKDQVQAIITSQAPDPLLKTLGVIARIGHEGTGEIILLSKGKQDGQYNMIYQDCIHCKGQDWGEGGEPICLSVTTYYKQLVLELLGWRLQVEETDCGATHGSPNCHFLVQRV